METVELFVKQINRHTHTFCSKTGCEAGDFWSIVPVIQLEIAKVRLGTISILCPLYRCEKILINIFPFTRFNDKIINLNVYIFTQIQLLFNL